MYLLDTDVVSLTRRLHRHPALQAWLSDLPREAMFLSVLTLGEIELGIVRARVRDPAFAEDLSRWRRDLEEVAFAGRILDFGHEEALVWGGMAGRVGNKEPDVMIAATAQVHGLTVVTRNVRHFAPTGVPVFDPSGQGMARG